MRAQVLLLGLALGFGIVSAQVMVATLAPAYAQAAPAEEKQAFEAAKELGTVEAWDAFLSNYSTGFHADLARAYLKKMVAEPAAAPAAAAPSAGAAATFDYPMVAGSWGGIVRAGPGQDYDKIASLKEGEEVTLMGPGQPVQANDYPWFKISFGDGDKTGYMWGGLLCSTGAERPDIYKLCTFTPVRSSGRASRSRDGDDEPRTNKKTAKQANSGSSKCSRHEVYSSSMKQCIPKSLMCEKNEVYSSSLASCMPRM